MMRMTQGRHVQVLLRTTYGNNARAKAVYVHSRSAINKSQNESLQKQKHKEDVNMKI
jgi:hypothetical protein